MAPNIPSTAPVLCPLRSLTLCSTQAIAYLIQRVPEKHFKQIRYYGLYIRHREADKKIHLAIANGKRNILIFFKRRKNLTLISCGYDPLKCPCCGENMYFLDLYHNHQHFFLNKFSLEPKASTSSDLVDYLLCPSPYGLYSFQKFSVRRIFL